MSLPPLVAPATALSVTERSRTARHLRLAGFGDDAQRRLANAHVAVVGAGGLGSPAILALCAAGVGTLTVIDDDTVELSNLQRQILHRLGDVGSPKTDSASRAAADLSETVVHTRTTRLDAANAQSLLAGADLVIDGSDTLATRRAVAAACERAGIPLVWGVVQEYHAQISVFWSAPPAGREAVVLSDLHAAGDEDPPSCAQVGVLSTLTLEAGAVMAGQAVALITGVGEPLLGRVLLIDALRSQRTEIPLHRAETAPAFPSAPQAPPRGAALPPVDPPEMLRLQEQGATLLDVREPWETDTGVVAGSVLIPLGTFLADPAALDAEGPVVVICAHGIRAERAAEALRQRGTTATVLAGGIEAWR